MRLEYPPAFGKIIVDGTTYEHDIVIYPSGRVERRKKEISKQKHGTSHKLDPKELKEYLTEDFDVLIVGDWDVRKAITPSWEQRTREGERSPRTPNQKGR